MGGSVLVATPDSVLGIGLELRLRLRLTLRLTLGGVALRYNRTRQQDLGWREGELAQL